MTVFIYVLRHPTTGDVRYVGKTVKPRLRLQGHVSAARKGKTYASCCWVRSLLQAGLMPAMEVIETVDEASVWQERERHWIAAHRSAGANLLNHTDGGDGAHNPPASTRWKMGASNRGKKFSDERRRALSEAQTGRKMPPSYSAKLAERNRGRVVSAEARAKNGAKHRGKQVSMDARQKLSAAHLWKQKSESCRAAMRAAAARKRVEKAVAACAAKAAGMSIREMRAGGFSTRDIGRAFGCSHQTIRARLAASA